MAKKILSIDDLYSFYSHYKRNMNFSSEKSGYNLCVSSHGTFEVKESDDSEGLLYAQIKAFHDLSNRNQSYIDSDVFESKLQTMKDRPIMADIVEVEDEEGKLIKDFSGHTMNLDTENDKIIYIEKPIGHFVNPENFKAEYDEELGRTFAVADCVIYEEYTDACDILRRRGSVDCSVELCIRDMSYDAKNKVLVLNDYYVQGCTLLGENVAPGMFGSKLTLKDFSEENNSVFSNHDRLIEALERLNDTLSNFNIQAESAEENSGKEEDNLKLNELLEKYGKTIEEIEFDYDNMSDEELETAFAEAFAEPEENDDDESEETTVENEEVAEENVEVEETEAEQEEAPVFENKFSVALNGKTSEFALSLNAKIEALTILVNDAYSEADNCYYAVEAFDDCVVMVDYWTNRGFRQSYKCRKDVYTLVGDRVPVFHTWATQDELDALDSMKKNYALIDLELNKYKVAEEFADKMKVFEDEDYAEFLDTDEFKQLMSEDFIMNTSKEDIQTKADVAFAKLIKAKGTFAKKVDTEKKPAVFQFGSFTNGGNESFLDKLRKESK